MKLRNGDIFVSAFPTAGIGTMIKGIQSMWAIDKDANYSHAGILSVDGWGFVNTIESLWTVKSQQFWPAYNGAKVMIGRPINTGQDISLDIMGGSTHPVFKSITKEKIQNTIGLMVVQEMGKKYPWWRLGLHIIPPLARRISYKGKFKVCSELVAYYCNQLEIKGFENYMGINPDDIASRIRYWDAFTIIAEGVVSNESRTITEINKRNTEGS